MAEIHLERKEGRNWLWMVLAIVLLALLAWWYFSQRGSDGDPVITEAPGAVISDTVPGPGVGTGGEVNGYLAFVDNNRAGGEMGRDHEFTADGVRRLAMALGAIADRDTVVGAALEPRMDSLTRHADALQRNEDSARHAAMTRDAFTRAVAIMDDLQRRQYPDVAALVAQARQAAEAVQPGRPLLEQRTSVQLFFDRSADVLRNMANAERSPALST